MKAHRLRMRKGVRYHLGKREEAYSVELLEWIGLPNTSRGALRDELERMEKAGILASRLAPSSEHGGRTGLPRRYYRLAKKKHAQTVPKHGEAGEDAP